MSSQMTPSMVGTHQRRLGRSALALLAGFVAVVILSIATDILLCVFRVFPPLGQPMLNGLFMFATAYRTVYAVLGSYITARMAPDRPMGHALAGGVVGLLLSIVGAVSTWKHVELGPHWYPLALVVTALPCAWVGGRIREIQVSRRGK